MLTEYVYFTIAIEYLSVWSRLLMDYNTLKSLQFYLFIMFCLVVIEKLCSMTYFLLYTFRDLSFNRLEKQIPDIGTRKNLTHM
jgi:hypothetical protein